jgi:hypothetical protein
MTLRQSVRYYRDEYIVERGFQRSKGGALPVLPWLVRIDERIKGLVFLLVMALRILTLIDVVASQELAKTDEKIAGLVPANPQMALARPTAEKLLAAFEGPHPYVEQQGDTIVGYMVEKLSPLPEKILNLLQIPGEIYDLSFGKVRVEDDNDLVEEEVGLTMAAWENPKWLGKMSESQVLAFAWWSSISLRVLSAVVLSKTSLETPKTMMMIRWWNWLVDYIILAAIIAWSAIEIAGW